MENTLLTCEKMVSYTEGVEAGLLVMYKVVCTCTCVLCVCVGGDVTRVRVGVD